MSIFTGAICLNLAGVRSAYSPKALRMRSCSGIAGIDVTVKGAVSGGFAKKPLPSVETGGKGFRRHRSMVEPRGLERGHPGGNGQKVNALWRASRLKRASTFVEIALNLNASPSAHRQGLYRLPVPSSLAGAYIASHSTCELKQQETRCCTEGK